MLFNKSEPQASAALFDLSCNTLMISLRKETASNFHATLRIDNSCVTSIMYLSVFSDKILLVVLKLVRSLCEKKWWDVIDLIVLNQANRFQRVLKIFC